eukprot:10862035-Ditylum_brightwellii.AAC.1
MRSMLGWLPLEVVKHTFECTTHYHKSRTPQHNVPRLAETFATDTLFSFEPGLGSITCAQLFVGSKSKLTKIYDMRTESEDHDAFDGFIHKNGAPYAIISGNAKMQIGISFTKILCKYNNKSEHTEPHHHQKI